VQKREQRSSPDTVPTLFSRSAHTTKFPFPISFLKKQTGLVRTGVAPDHPEVKQVTADFETVATDPRFSFLGNVRVGTDVSVAELRALYDGVILAYGASSDRGMGIPGEELNNVCSARAFVNWYNGHPDFRNFAPNLEAEDVVIIGQGNVAIDCARVLCKTPAELAETDIAAHAFDALARSKVKRVHVVGRRGHVQAAMTMKELREVTRLADCSFHVSSEELARGRTAASMTETETARAKKRMDALLAEQAKLDGSGDSAKKSKQLFLRFLLQPHSCLPSATDAKSVGSFDFDVTALEGEAEKQSAKVSGKKETIKAGMVLKSIGYKSMPLPGVPFDDRRAVVRNVKGRVVKDAAGEEPEVGLYCAGWLKRGPTGIVGTNITDARETVACLLEDHAAGRLPVRNTVSSSSSRSALANLRDMLVSKGMKREHLVPWEGWRRLDELELAAGKEKGKSREKFVVVADMLKEVEKVQAKEVV
jgi:adrenodoxin-NADP+ reductase